MKLWEKGVSTDARVSQFTVGDDPLLDRRLARYDIAGSIAHARMLSAVELISQEEGELLVSELQALLSQAQDDTYLIAAGMEDIHSQVESDLIKALGEVGKKIHTARSRNDQILVDLRLYLRDAVYQIVEITADLIGQLLALGQQHQNVLIPGYTHLQAAMPSSFGLWFSAYAETLIDDLRQWAASFQVINQNPLGSAAGYGTSLPIDRHLTQTLLGFADLNYNVVHAQMGRGKTEQSVAFSIAGQAMTLAKLAMDVCLYNSQNFGFITLSDMFTTGSSIMPHKKNPDVFELIRGHCNRLQQLPTEISAVCASLPSGYHRDFQLLKGVLFRALDDFKDCLLILSAALDHIEVNDHIMEDERYRMIYSVERANELVTDGVPFREAYQQVAREIAAGRLEIPEKLAHTHIGSLGNLSLDSIKVKKQTVLDQFDFSYRDQMNELVENFYRA